MRYSDYVNNVRERKEMKKPTKLKFKTFEEVEKFFEDKFEWFATCGYKTKVIGTTLYYWKKGE